MELRYQSRHRCTSAGESKTSLLGKLLSSSAHCSLPDYQSDNTTSDFPPCPFAEVVRHFEAKLDPNFVELRISSWATHTTFLHLSCKGRRGSETFVEVISCFLKVGRSSGIVAHESLYAGATSRWLLIIAAERRDI